MKLCIISYHFPPIRTVGIRRSLRLVKEALAQGHEVKVFSLSPRCAPDYYAIEPASADSLDRRAEVIRLWITDPLLSLVKLRNRLRKALAGKPAQPGRKEPPPAAGAGQGTGEGGRSGTHFLLQPLMDPMWDTSFIVSGLFQFIRAYAFSKPDRIYVTGPPWSPLVLAALLSRICRIPLTVDYRDPWSLRAPKAEWFARAMARMERFVHAQADTIIYNTDRMRRQYAEGFSASGSKGTAIYNAIDDDLVQEVEAAKRDVPAPSGGCLIVHAGTLYSFRMPPQLAEAFAEAATDPFGGAQMRLRFVGESENAHLEEAFARRGMRDRLEFTGGVKAHAAKVEQLRADIVMILQLGTRIQLPAKVFECALLGRPLLCITEEDSETADFVRRFSLGEVVTSPRPELIRAAVDRLLPPSLEFKPDMAGLLDQFSGGVLSKKMLHAIAGTASRER